MAWNEQSVNEFKKKKGFPTAQRMPQKLFIMHNFAYFQFNFNITKYVWRFYV